MRTHHYSSDELYDLADEAPFDSSGLTYRKIFDHLERPLSDLASRFQRRSTAEGAFERQDYVSVARKALFEWIEGEVLDRSLRFETVAMALSRYAMIELARDSRGLKRGQAGRVYKKVWAAHDRLAQRLGRAPSVDEVVIEVNRDRSRNLGSFVVGQALSSKWSPPRLEDLRENHPALSLDAPEVEVGLAARLTEEGSGLMHALSPVTSNSLPSLNAARFAVLGVFRYYADLSRDELHQMLSQDRPEYDGALVGKPGETVMWEDLHQYFGLQAYGVPTEWREIGPTLFWNESRAELKSARSLDNLLNRAVDELRPRLLSYA